MVKRRELFIFFALLLLGIFFIYIYSYIKQAEQDIFSRVQEDKIKQIAYLFKNIEEDIVTTHILKDSQSLADMFSDKNTREQY
ncbi:MAG: bifunctional diguanylate cyclase/phosphodiesterase, partial [Campylobacterota bacterium]|nr:bifunctional diguanylate cyclase/phosphodiesterase [Campylobacterota bacterium]